MQREKKKYKAKHTKHGTQTLFTCERYRTTAVKRGSDQLSVPVHAAELINPFPPLFPSSYLWESKVMLDVWEKEMVAYTKRRNWQNIFPFNKISPTVTREH